MIVYPAIDIKNGRAVRLLQGRAGDVTDYGLPVEMAEKWQSLGAKWLHMVDLDGAFEGGAVNKEQVSLIVKTLSIPIELGGGIRTLNDVKRWMDAGVERVIIGTAAVENPQMVEDAAKLYPGHIAVGIDAKDGIVMTRGWVKSGRISAVDLALRIKDQGVDTVIYTDISRDGMMGGANVEQTGNLIKATGLNIIGSGGVNSTKDIRKLKNAGCAGVITGKALYTGAFTLKEALEAAE